MVGIPVGWRGKVGGMISCDTEDAPSSWLSTMFSLRTRKAWYSVSGDDYLNRGHVRGGLEEKLKMYLGREVRLSSFLIELRVLTDTGH